MKSRVVTALALLPLVLAAFAEPHGFGIWGLAVLVSSLSYVEFCAIANQTSQRMPWLGLLLAAGTLWGGIASPSPILLVCLVLAAIIGILTVARGATGSQAQISGMWIYAPLLAIYMTHRIVEPYADHWSLVRPAFMCVFPLWAGDTFGIFVGKLFGKHKLARNISPSKTIAGAVGNLFGAITVGGGFGLAMGVPVPQSLACGLIAGTFGQAGDLFESWFKRQHGAKDSGSILPGHGGILDRADSILFASPLIALLLALWR